MHFRRFLSLTLLVCGTVTSCGPINYGDDKGLVGSDGGPLPGEPSDDDPTGNDDSSSLPNGSGVKVVFSDMDTGDELCTVVAGSSRVGLHVIVQDGLMTAALSHPAVPDSTYSEVWLEYLFDESPVQTPEGASGTYEFNEASATLGLVACSRMEDGDLTIFEAGSNFTGFADVDQQFGQLAFEGYEGDGFERRRCGAPRAEYCLRSEGQGSFVASYVGTDPEQRFRIDIAAVSTSAMTWEIVDD